MASTGHAFDFEINAYDGYCPSFTLSRIGGTTSECYRARYGGKRQNERGPWAQTFGVWLHPVQC